MARVAVGRLRWGGKVGQESPLLPRKPLEGRACVAWSLRDEVGRSVAVDGELAPTH